MKMIIDFIKSWLYYPKLKQWLKERNFDKFPNSRFQYAYKHFRMKRRVEEAKKDKDNECSEWACKFQQEPICKE